MKQKTKDNLVYLGVVGIIVAALTFYIFYTDRTIGTIPTIPKPILWGILSTPGIVALIFEQFWHHRRRRALWVISGAAASINASVMFIAYSSQWDLPVIVWSVATVLYVVVVFMVTKRFLVRNRNG